MTAPANKNRKGNQDLFDKVRMKNKGAPEPRGKGGDRKTPYQRKLDKLRKKHE